MSEKLVRARIAAVQDLCVSSFEHDYGKAGNGWTDRQWLAMAVLDILGGKIDEQL